VYDRINVTAPTSVFRNDTDTVALHLRYLGAPANTTTVPLHLGWFDHRAQAASRITGLPATPLTITVVPRVTDQAGHAFAPQFPLTLTPLALTAPADPSKLTARGTTSATVGRSCSWTCSRCPLRLAGRSSTYQRSRR